MEENEERIVAITTIDNPYDPIDDFEHWFQFDVDKGYYTCSSIGRLINDSEEMSEPEKDKELERVIDRLIEIDPLAIYKKVEKIVKK